MKICLTCKQEKSEEYKKIVEKAATKSTKTVNNSTYNRNNYLNYVSSEPIKFGEIQQKIDKLVTTRTIMYDNDDFKSHIQYRNLITKYLDSFIISFFIL